MSQNACCSRCRAAANRGCGTSGGSPGCPKTVGYSVADPDTGSGIRDPGFGAFLTPGSGIGFFRIPDLGSQAHIFESLVIIFWINSSLIL